VTSRSRSQSSSGRNSSRHPSVKRRHEGGDQRAGIEGRAPRSHPQVLTISRINTTNVAVNSAARKTRVQSSILFFETVGGASTVVGEAVPQ
jgi:hypothetical protein